MVLNAKSGPRIRHQVPEGAPYETEQFALCLGDILRIEISDLLRSRRAERKRSGKEQQKAFSHVRAASVRSGEESPGNLNGE